METDTKKFDESLVNDAETYAFNEQQSATPSFAQTLPQQPHTDFKDL